MLHFEPSTHTYTLGGAVLPSVTQILKPLYSFHGVSQEVLDAKAALGTAVHRACELLDNDDLDQESEEGKAGLEPIAGYLAGYVKFKAEMQPKVLENERQLHHPTHLYAGTIDRRYSIKNDLWDIDLKSTVAMSPIVGLQTAAYSEMFKANGARGRARRGALQLFPDGKYKLWEFKEPSDFAVFLSLLNVLRFKERHSL
ncbi:MAG: hypothetical protein V4614_15110 [Pseudomonadota bacterium]